MKSGKSQTVIIGKITVQQSNLFFLRYYSNRLFLDGTSGAWKDTPAKGDSINLNRDAAGILRDKMLAWGRARGVTVRLPEKGYCTDNAAMIAFAGLQRAAGDPRRVTARSRIA